QSELKGKTTIEASPDSEQAKIYARLAEKIASHDLSDTPSPLATSELQAWAASWSDQILALESGVVAGGVRAGI
ncbi:MAG: hypothetical protein LBF92_03730, partial [Synergistaceae bacterium]|nr:hypothetical protein [Synergistaceae bacterium]